MLWKESSVMEERLRFVARLLECEGMSDMCRTFGQRFLKEHVAVHCKPSTCGEYKRSVELFINPKLDSHRIIDMTCADIVGLH